jgi:hypothetical protein
MAFAGSCLWLLFYYAFASVIPPDLPAAERTRVITERFLFYNGPSQMICVVLVAMVASTGLASFLVHLLTAIFGKPNQWNAALASGILGLFGAIVFIAFVLTLRM